MPGPLYPLQPVFARGELSPRLFSRADIDHYKMGLSECVNWLVMKQGGLRRRPGTEWIDRAKYSYFKCRLVRFVFSTQQAYVLEFGHGYIRFYANGGIVNKGQWSGIVFNPGTNLINFPTPNNLAVGDKVVFSSTGSLPPEVVEHGTYFVTAISTYQIQISDTPGGVSLIFSTGGTGVHSILAPIELVAPWDYNQVWKLQFAQSADVLYIAHPDFQQMMLSRFSGSTFSLVPYTGFDGPYLPENTTATSCAPSATAGIVTVSFDSTVGINANTGFHASDVGRWLSLKYSNKWYGMRITTVLNAASR